MLDEWEVRSYTLISSLYIYIYVQEKPFANSLSKYLVVIESLLRRFQALDNFPFQQDWV